MSKRKTIAFLKGLGNKNPGLSKTQAKTVSKIATKVVNRHLEKKVFGFQGENVQLLHNKGDYLGSYLKCKQGLLDANDIASGQATRVGDEILLKNISVRLWLSNKEDRPNVMYKCYLFWYDVGSSLTDATMFFTQTNKMLDRINNEHISVIDSKTIFSGPSYSETGNEHSYLCTLKGKWKSRKIVYDSGGFTPRKRDIGTCVVCYDAFGTLQSDNIASYAYNSNVVFTDA